MRIPLLSIFLVIVSVAFSADPRPTIRSIAGREYIVEDHWAGQSFTIVEKGDGLEMVWKIFGSGVPVVSESRIPIIIKNEWQIRAKPTDTDCPREIKVEIGDQGEVRVFIDGIRIYIFDGTPSK